MLSTRLQEAAVTGASRSGPQLAYWGGSKEIGALQVRPLRRQLKGLKAWITGQRKDQSPGTRASVPVVQVDPVFEGQAGGQASLVKYNPLSNVSSQEVWNFLRVMVCPPLSMLEGAGTCFVASAHMCVSDMLGAESLSAGCGSWSFQVRV